MSGMTDRERLLAEQRPVACAIAYRVLGGVSEAEDVVQEALLRLHLALQAGERIASPRAFVATLTTRLEVNGGPGALWLDAQQRLIAVWSLDVAGGQIAGIRSIVNPDKLAHLGPVGDFASLLMES